MIQILKLLIIYLRSLGFWEPAGSIEYLSIYIFICICWWKQRYTALTIIGLKSAGFATLILAASLSAVLQILCDTTSPWNISSYSLPDIKKPHCYKQKCLYLVHLRHHLREEGVQGGEFPAEVDIPLKACRVGDCLWVWDFEQEALHIGPLVLQELVHEGHVLFLVTESENKQGQRREAMTKKDGEIRFWKGLAKTD